MDSRLREWIPEPFRWGSFTGGTGKDVDPLSRCGWCASWAPAGAGLQECLHLGVGLRRPTLLAQPLRRVSRRRGPPHAPTRRTRCCAQAQRAAARSAPRGSGRDPCLPPRPRCSRNGGWRPGLSPTSSQRLGRMAEGSPGPRGAQPAGLRRRSSGFCRHLVVWVP